MGYICAAHTYEIGQTYSAKKEHEHWADGITVYDKILAICRYHIIDGTYKYEVSIDKPSEVTVVREISKDEFIKRCTGRHVDSDGTELWYVGGKLHRTDGPAIVYTNGTKRWYVDGNPHREDGPAVISTYGTKEWYLDNKRVDPPSL